MAHPRKILKRKKATLNIREITKTMELISAARFRKNHVRFVQTKPYIGKVLEMMNDIFQTDVQLDHPLLNVRSERKRAALLLICSNRGLCGGFNSRVIETGKNWIDARRAEGLEVDLYVAGKKGIIFFRFQNYPLAKTYTEFEGTLKFSSVESIADILIRDYSEGRVDVASVAYTKFITSAQQRAVVEDVLPIAVPAAQKDAAKSGTVDYLFDPDPHSIFEELLPMAVKVNLYRCFLEASVSEQVARMVAMRRATENAEKMIRNLTRTYNRARQTQITKEISEIMGGAEALKFK